MGLESLTPAEREALSRAQDAQRLLNELLTDSDPEVRRGAMKLAKKKRPDLRFPELEAEEIASSKTKATEDRLHKLEEELQQERALRLRADEENRIRARGYDPAQVYKVMEERGVANLDTMLDVLDASAQLGEPSGGSVHTFKNPAEEILKDVKTENGFVDIDALRGRLVEQAVNDLGVNGRRPNPLGWLQQGRQS
jgi:hypothetical protein